MTTQDLKARYDELYHTMKESKDVANMRTFGEAFTRLYNKVAEVHPDLAMATLNLLESINYNNFVTAEDATELAGKFINADKTLTGAPEGSKGAHWRMDEAKAFLTSRNLPTEEKSYYNWPAIWLTMNMIYSDYADTLVEVLGTKDGEKIATTCYKFAISKLKDPDRPRFIRSYFSL